MYLLWTFEMSHVSDKHYRKDYCKEIYNQFFERGPNSISGPNMFALSFVTNLFISDKTKFILDWFVAEFKEFLRISHRLFLVETIFETVINSNWNINWSQVKVL